MRVLPAYYQFVGYEWLAVALTSLRGIEPHEVIQVLGARRRWPRPAVGPDGHQVVTIWGRTSEGRALVVAVRQLTQWDWQILGARDLDPAETTQFEAWEGQ